MPILSWGVEIFNTPNFNGPTNFLPVSWTCQIFFGVSRNLIEAVDEEKRLIEIILQIMTIIPLLYVPPFPEEAVGRKFEHFKQISEEF